MKYDIVSVGWNKRQADIWLYYINKHCPEAHVTLIPDNRPIPWCWSSGKIDCFKQKFKTDKIIYMDTDCIVTADLFHIFKDMGNCIIGLSDKITPRPYFKKNKQAKEGLAEMWRILSPRFPPEHFSSGMIAVRGDYAPNLHKRWLAMMEYPPFLRIFKNFKLADEMSLMCLMANDFERNQIYNIPLEVHGNLLGRTVRSGEVDIPEVIHYHKINRARSLGFTHCFDEDKRKKGKCPEKWSDHKTDTIGRETSSPIS